MRRKGGKIMSKIKGLIKWFESCPLIEEVSEIDVCQLNPQDPAVALYKQPGVTVQRLIDGSEIRTENYYLLFLRPMKLKNERVSNEEYLENIEEWVWDQEMAENYPDIGHPIHNIEMSNAFYMMSRTEDEAEYQFTVSITYERGVNT